MKKIKIIKKLTNLAILGALFLPLSFVDVSNNRTQLLNKGQKKSETNIHKFVDDSNSFEYTFISLPENEKHLSLIDIKSISEKPLKIREIDFEHIHPIEEDFTGYQLKWINMPAEKYSIFLKEEILSINMGPWKWSLIDQNFFNGINKRDLDFTINLGKEVFDDDFVKTSLNHNIKLQNCTFNNIRINIEQHESKNNLIGLWIYNLTAENLIFNGAKMNIDCRLDYGMNKLFNNCVFKNIIFENEITGLNFAAFERVSYKYSWSIKLFFCNVHFLLTGKQFDLWSSTYNQNPLEYNMNSFLNFYFYNEKTEFNFIDKSYQVEDNSYTSKWYSAMCPKGKHNRCIINMMDKMLEKIQANPEKLNEWNLFIKAGEERPEEEGGGRWPLYKIIDNDSLPKNVAFVSEGPKNNECKVKVGDTIKFDLKFQFNSNIPMFISEQNLKMILKSRDFVPGNSSFEYLDETKYSVRFEIKNYLRHEVILYVTFLKPGNYHNYSFVYKPHEKHSLIFDGASQERNIVVESNEKLLITLSSDFDFNKKLSQGDSIIFKLEATKDVDWKNNVTGVKLDLTDAEGHKVNLNYYFNFEWIDDEITNRKAQFKITCEYKQFIEKALTLKVIKIDEPEIETSTKIIKLYDNQELSVSIKTNRDLSKPINFGESVNFVLTSSIDINLLNKIGLVLMEENNDDEINLYEYFSFKIINDSSTGKNINLEIKLIKNVLEEKKLRIKAVVLFNKQKIYSEPSLIKIDNIDADKTLSINTSSDLSDYFVKDSIIQFNLQYSRNINWESKTNGVKFVLTDNENTPINLSDYFEFTWDIKTQKNARFSLKSTKKHETERIVKIKAVKIDDESIETQTKTIRLYDPTTTLTLSTTTDLEKEISINNTIDFVLNSTTKFNWKNEFNGAKFLLTDSSGIELKLSDYFDFMWINSSITKTSAGFKLISNHRHKDLTIVKLKVVKKNDQTISTETKTIKLFDQPEPKVRITLSSDYDFSRKLAKDESIVFKLEATKDVEWKNTLTGVKIVLTNDEGNEIEFKEYFDFKWIDGQITRNKAQFEIKSKNKQHTEKALTLKVVKIDDTSIETTSKTIKLFDEQQLQIKLNADKDLLQPISKGETISFNLESTKDIVWRDQLVGVKLIATNNKNEVVNLDDYFELNWVDESINLRSAKFTLTSKIEHLEKTILSIKAIVIQDYSITSDTLWMSLLDQKNNANSIIIAGSTSGAAVVLAGIIALTSTLIFRKKRK